MQRHSSNKAKSGPPPDRPPSPAPPPPPRWRSWLLPVGLLLSVLLLLVPNQMEEGRVTDLTYAPELKEKIAAGQVQSVEIGSDGHIEGKLKDAVEAFIDRFRTSDGKRPPKEAEAEAMEEGEEGRERIHTRLDHPEWEHVRILGETIRSAELVDAELPFEELPTGRR